MLVILYIMYINNIDFQFFLLLLLFTISAIYIIKLMISTDEQFDAKVNNASRKQCGHICTKLTDCRGFSSDEQGICYLSQTPILGRPTNSVFMTDYNKNYMRCNKLAQIVMSEDTSTDDYKKNATYICAPNEVVIDPKIMYYAGHNRLDTQAYYAGHNRLDTQAYYDNDEQTLNNLNDLNNVSFSPYSIENINWGSQIDLTKNPNLATNPTAENSVFVMEKHDNEYLGEYMYPHQCSTNIKEQDCLQQCMNESTCMGTEYNPAYLVNGNLYTGVCCPKMQIKQIIPRRQQYQYGSFYLKNNIYKSDMTINDLYEKL